MGNAKFAEPTNTFTDVEIVSTAADGQEGYGSHGREVEPSVIST